MPKVAHKADVLAPANGPGRAVRVELEPAELAALIQFGERGFQMLSAIGQVRSSGAIDAAIHKLRAAQRA